MNRFSFGRSFSSNLNLRSINQSVGRLGFLFFGFDLIRFDSIFVRSTLTLPVHTTLSTVIHNQVSPREWHKHRTRIVSEGVCASDEVVDGCAMSDFVGVESAKDDEIDIATFSPQPSRKDQQDHQWDDHGAPCSLLP